jgi:sugar lactone lactonase YvrE
MVSLRDVAYVGKELVRPECVLATLAGDLYAGDWRGGIAHVKPDGSQALYLGRTTDIPEGLRPNGIALESDGSFLFANLGTDVGGAWRIDRKGQVRPVLAELEGAPIPPSNFVTRDAKGRLWLTVSTRVRPRSADFRADASTGYIVMMDGKGARIVTDGLGYTNECYVDPTGQWLYVIETYGRRLSRLPLEANGDLGPKEVVASFGKQGFPDGFAFDAEGCCWVALVVSNQLVRVDHEGRTEIVLEDLVAPHVAEVEQAFERKAVERPHIDTNPSETLRNISNVAFGGPELDTIYLGCLSGDRIAKLPAPTRGHAPVHWRYPTT